MGAGFDEDGLRRPAVDALPGLQAGPAVRRDVARGALRGSGEEPDPLAVSEVPRPSRGGGLPRRLGEGHHRRRHRRARPRSADGRGPAGAPSRSAQAVVRARQDRRRAARASASSPRCSASSSRWATSTARPQRSAITSARRSSARSSAFCCRTASSQPIAQALEQRVDEDQYYCLCIKAGLLAVYKGNPPAIAVEFARRVLPHSVRPSFNETEQFCRAATKGPDEEWRSEGDVAALGHEQGPAGHHRQEEGQGPRTAITAARGRWRTPTS